MANAKRNAPSASPPLPILKKFNERLQPGFSEYFIVHNLGTKDVLVQTRIGGRVREGGITILDENRISLTFGGTLNEQMDVVIIG